MATLKDRLDAIRKSFEGQAPAAALAIMHRATDDLAASGQAERALGVGASFPDFELPDPNGQIVSSQVLRGRGPMVLTVFRGQW